MEGDHNPESNFFVEMYAIPSQSLGISERAIERYFNCHKINDQINEAISLKDEKKIFCEKIEELDKNKDQSLIKELIEKGLESDNVGVQKEAIKVIEFVEKPDRKALIKKGLESDNIDVQKEAIRLVNLVEISDRKALIEKGLKIDNIKVQKESARMIFCVNIWEQDILDEEVKKIIEKGLENDDIEIQKKAISMIRFIKRSDRRALIEKGLESNNFEIQKESARMIFYTDSGEHDILKKEVKKIIEKGLESDNFEVQKESARMIIYTDSGEHDILKKEVKKIIEKGLESDDIEIQKKAIKLIEFAEESDKKIFFDLVKSKGLSVLFVDPPLYDSKNVSDVYFERKNFDKTGSETTLIGGQLKRKSIIRHIKPEAFLSWQKTYEDYGTWEKAGFDYVPIEPIQSYFFDKNKKLVDVFSGVLDLNLFDWNNRSSLFGEDLMKQKERIENVLCSQEIKHGHLHDRNFALCFYRNQDGSINFNKKPRLYVIDFDQAVSILNGNPLDKGIKNR